MRRIQDTLEEAKHELKYHLHPDSRWGMLVAELVAEIEQCHIDLNEYALEEEHRRQENSFRGRNLFSNE